ncbi:MAG: DMT family transporter [Verrucomicrobia bacterium]|nr:DMT family transporter [Verrucomicrobiota bacterium]
MSNVTPAQHRQAIWMLLLANLLWGVSFPLVKSLALLQERLAPGTGSWFITATALLPRFSIGALVLGVICWPGVRTLTARELRQGVGLGVFAVLGMAFQNDGLQFTSASTSAFLTQLYAVMIPAYLALRGRHLPPWGVWVGCALVLAGVAVLARVDWHHFRLGRGEIETLVCSVFFMGQILWLERREFAGNRMLPVTFVMFLVQALTAAGLMAVLARPGANLTGLATNGAWLGLTALLTLLCTLGSFTIMNVYQPRITATEAGLLYCAEPLFTALMALFLPAWFAAWGGFVYANETVSVHLVIGGGLITLANVIVQLRPPSRP